MLLAQDMQLSSLPALHWRWSVLAGGGGAAANGVLTQATTVAIPTLPAGQAFQVDLEKKAKK